jgi:PAP2 superfamily
MKKYMGALSLNAEAAGKYFKRSSIAQRALNALLYLAPTPELGLAMLFASVAVIISQIVGLPFSLPGANALQFTGMSYAVPFSIVGGWVLLTILSKRKYRVFYYLAASLAYGVVVIVHFNVKMWMNIVNPVRWDGLYWRADQAMRPLVDGSFAVHNAVGSVLPMENHLYLFAFLAMFVCSIVVHSMRCFIVFRKVIFTAMLVHVLGALSYLIMPAVGPFLYEAGSNALETARQVHMYNGYQAMMAGGRPWIAEYGADHMFAAVAAMPSLHVASSAVFVYYAFRYERWLGWCYLPLFLFIIVEAVATRWHYIVDIFAGLGLTAVAIMICALIFKPISQHHMERRALRKI